jgi:AAA domain
MYSPWRFQNRVGDLGKPLPDTFPIFEEDENRVRFRKGGTSLIAGAPGSFKSVFSLNLAVQWAQQGIGCMYFSADCDENTVIMRLSGILTGNTMKDVETNLLEEKPGKYVKALKGLEGVEFEYAQMDTDGIVEHVQQYEAFYGQHPGAIFIDNLIDFVDSPDDYGGMITFIRDMAALAGQTKSHVCILHHARLPDGKATTLPPQDREIAGRVTQIPKVVLTMAASGRDLYMSCVKNTLGPQYRDARKIMGFKVSESMQINEREIYAPPIEEAIKEIPEALKLAHVLQNVR